MYQSYAGMTKGSLLELEGDYQVIQEQCRSTIKMVSKQDGLSTPPSSSAVDNDTINTSTSLNTYYAVLQYVTIQVIVNIVRVNVAVKTNPVWTAVMK